MIHHLGLSLVFAHNLGILALGGMVREKTIADLEVEHGKAIHVEKNWNGKVIGIRFENKDSLFWLDKTRPFGMVELPEVVNDDERCQGTFKHGGRCTRYNNCTIHSLSLIHI